MKKLNLLLLSLFSSAILLYGQTFHYDYQDGLVVFQLKEHAKIIPSSAKKVEWRSVSFYKNLQSYSLVEMVQLHPTVLDNKLRRTYQIEVAEYADVEGVIRTLKSLPEIEYAEKKELHRLFLTPNDLGPNATNAAGSSPTNNQWSLWRINAQQAWDLSTGSATVKVAVTDNAMNTSHPDLVNKMLPGYDATTGGTNPNPCGGNDGFHGSHVCGIVGAQTNNGTGIASIGYNVSIIPVKIGRCSDGALTAGYEGVTWAADNGADVINMSWGGGGSSTYGQNVCNYAWNQGAILVAAAGNDGVSTPLYPAAYNNVIAVASTTTNDAKSTFSQFGTWINISAPGSSILSCNQNTGYTFSQGTSMASPLVAGLVGLIKSHAPNASKQDIINCLYSGADNIDAANSSFIGQLGAGRINAFNSLTCAGAFNVQLDAGITAINNPGTTVCGSSFTPSVVLRNFGSTTLTAVTINYNWNGTNSTFNWTGSLTTGQTTVVNLPVQTATTGSYTFTASTSNPNGSADQNSANDQMTKAFSVDVFGQTVNLQLTLDCFGSEISWQIRNDQNAVVFSGGGYTDTPGGQVVNGSFCLPTGCYTFAINDTYGDGMYGSQWQSCSVNGNYVITDASSATLVQMTATNGNFGYGTTHSFCVVAPNINNDAGISQVNSPSGFVCTNAVSPVVELKNFGSNTLTSCVINYNLGGAPQSFNWTGSLTTGQTTNVTLPSISTSQGQNTLTVSTASPNNQSDDNTSNDQIAVTFSAFITAQTLPFVESFETDVIANGLWSIDNPDGAITWERVAVGGNAPGNQAMKIDFFNYEQNSQRDGLISPKISLIGYSSAQMTFHHAYRRFNQTAADSLVIYVSTNCGATYTRVFGTAEDGTGAFATATTNTNAFTPSISTDWCFDGTVGASCFTINLNAFVGNDILIKFESFNAGTIGNNLFIDNINIDGVPSLDPPVANFVTDRQAVCVGETVTYTDLSTANITSWNWTFPGGNPATSIQQNPVVQYATPGQYSATLQVTNANGTDNTTVSSLITVTANPATPVISRTGNTLSVTLSAGQTVEWQLNGAYFGNTALVNMTTTGTYTATITNAQGCTSSASGNFELSTSSVAELRNGQELVLFPNPTNGQFEVLVRGGEYLQSITVYDAIGRKVYSVNLSNSRIERHQMDLTHSTAGVYFVEIMVGESKITKKVTLRN
jgi:subtilisin family serine protease/PKD repeat protein